MTRYAVDDPTRPFEDTPKIIRSRRRRERHLNQRRAEHRNATITDKVEERFGPNPCQRLTLHNAETGDDLKLVCDSKRCHDCGSRKQAILKYQLTEGFGEYEYVLRASDRSDLDRSLERVRKQSARTGVEFLYNIVGDDYLGWIVVSNLPLTVGQGRTRLADWMDRILHAYRYGDSRIRRSRVLGRMSLITYKAVVKLGTSVWKAVFHRHQTHHDELLDTVIATRGTVDDWHVWEAGGVVHSSLDV